MEIIDPTFFKRFFSTLSELRATKEFCDVTLRCADEVIYAHKSVLSACSPFFKAMFKDGFSENKQEEIELRHDTNYTVMSAIIDYMYSGIISISLKNVAILLNNLDYLQMEEAKEQWESLAVSKVNTKNCVELFVQAESISKRSLEVLQEATLRCIVDNLHEIFNSTEFKELTVDHLQIILPKVVNTKADTICKAIMNWVEHDPENRNIYFESLLNNVPIEHLSRSEIYSSILRNDLLRNNEVGCKGLVDSFLGKESPVLHKVLHVFEKTIGAHPTSVFEFDVGRFSMTKGINDTPLFVASVTKYKNDFYLAYKSLFAKLESNTYEHMEFGDFSTLGCSLCAGYDQVYIIGGMEEGKAISSCSRYNCEQDDFIDIARMLNKRTNPGVAFYNSALYVFGGNESEIVERFDPREGHWCIAGEVPLHRACSATTLANSIYCLDYNLIINYDPRVESYNPIKNHKGNSITSLDGRLFIGYDGGIAEYLPSTNNWDTISVHKFSSTIILA